MKQFKFITLLLAIFTMCVVMSCNRHSRVEQPVITEQVDSVDTIKMTPMESVNMMLDIRKEMIDSHHIDSMYMHMPEDIITLIVFDNPDCDVSWVVKHYEENKQYYDNVIEQKKKIEEYKKKYTPDSLDKEKPDISVRQI